MEGVSPEQLTKKEGVTDKATAPRPTNEFCLTNSRLEKLFFDISKGFNP
jgi:hypothetical protein